MAQAASAQRLTVTVPGPATPLKTAAGAGPFSWMVSGLHVIAGLVEGTVVGRP